PIRIQPRRAVTEDPSILTVTSPQPVLQLEFTVIVERLDVRFETALEVFRVNAFGPAVFLFLFYRPPRVIQPSAVEKIENLVRARCPEHPGSGIHDPLVQVIWVILAPLGFV